MASNNANNTNGQQGKGPPSSSSQGTTTNENRGGNNGVVPVARTKITKNPYATKKKSQPTQQSKSNANNNSTTGRNNGGSQPGNERRKRPPEPQNPVAAAVEMEAMAGASFSQAFGVIDDTDHFRNASMAQTATTTQDANERAQQRAFEAQTDPTANISDRDHHELLQPHVLSISTKQRGNGVISYIRNVPFAYSRMVPDYVFSPTSCALFLSCKYHSLHPQYIHRRIAELRTDFTVRVLLVLVDLDDNQSVLLFLNKLAVLHSLTLVLAWTEEEAARYLETFKALDGNDASLIQRKEKTNFVDQAAEFLAAGSANKTDSASLLTQFSTVKDIIAASKDELGMVTGLGEVKVARLYDAFHKPFSSKRQRERHNDSEEESEGIRGGTKSDDDDAKEPNNSASSDGGDKETKEPTKDDGAPST